MCFTGENGWASVYEISFHRARKPHKCCECGGPIPAGARYEYLFMVFDGEADGYHTHLECAAFWKFAIKELCNDEGTRQVMGLRDELGEYGGYGEDEDGEPGLLDILDAIRDGYERAATTK
jgi:hypothetical protein